MAQPGEDRETCNFCFGQIIIPRHQSGPRKHDRYLATGPEVGIDLFSDMLLLVKAFYRIAAGGNGRASPQGMALWIRNSGIR